MFLWRSLSLKNLAHVLGDAGAKIPQEKAGKISGRQQPKPPKQPQARSENVKGPVGRS